MKKNPSLHRKVGIIALVSSSFVSCASLIMSIRALHFTKPFYILAATLWVLFTFMSWLTVYTKDYISHRIWSHALFALGFMFTSTRFFIFFYNFLNIFSREFCYFAAVLSAGTTSIFYIISQEYLLD
jgi:hypothetical protein